MKKFPGGSIADAISCSLCISRYVVGVVNVCVPLHAADLFIPLAQSIQSNGVRTRPPSRTSAQSHGVLLIQRLGVSLGRPTLILRNAHLPETHLPASLAALLSSTSVTEADLGAELLALPRLVHHLVQLIDLLERQTLGLVDHEPNEEEANAAESAPDEEHLGLQVRVLFVDHVRCRVGNRKVEEPVGRRCHGEGFGADFEREEFAGYDPCDGPPAGGEVVDVQADERDGGALSGKIGRAGDGARDGHDELADTHASGTP